jgi:hypothetical protein
VLPLAGCGSSGRTIPKSELSKLVLQPADLPNGFAAFYLGKQLQADQTPRRSDPNRFGREGGWIGRYRRAGSPKTRGPLVVSSRVDLFGDAKGAERDLQLYRGDVDSGTLKRVTVKKLGDEAVAATTATGGSFGVRNYVIAWRRANATAEIEANGFARRFTLAGALALARRQDARLRAAAR